MTPKPLKNHLVRWSVSKQVFDGDGQRVAKPMKIHRCQLFSQKKNVPSHRSQKMTIAHLYVCCICLNYRAFWGDQTDPKYAGWGTNLILRTGPPTPSAENLFAKKPLVEMGESPLSLPEFFFPREIENYFCVK